ncbi:MAG TPA: NAD(P)/FAD-dependent oxidoreductase [Solirubrobacterales bacterium]|jgi:2-polyprenyl-6-methoxyphenol hydroxylase-like FAD-dependent oxidoreductase
MEEKDAVIVGARCAGSTLAIELAERGWDVLVVDRDTFPSETVSTHFLYPNTVARLEQLGVLDRLRSTHDIPLVALRIVGLGHEIAGTFTPVGGFDRCIGPRRSVLDQAIVDTALAAGAEARLGERVVDLIGAGTEENPVSGVVLENGDRVRAKWVFGADGRGSTVAGKLGLEKERPQRGELAFLFGYWKDIPDNGYMTLYAGEDAVGNRWAIEDGLHILIAGGDAEFTKGTTEDRRRNYLEQLRRMPELIEPETLERAELVTELTVAPESLMRGFFRIPAGPGWALLGDAAHFKHPATAQGISDAVEQAVYVAEQLSGASPSLDDYEAWRDARAVEHYDWSFTWGRFPDPALAGPLFRGWSSDADAGQDLRDTFSRHVEPSKLMTPERMARWFSDAPAPT